MHDGPLVHPPHVARPLRLRPFRGLTLDASRIGAPASVRAFTRPYDQVADRLESWARRGQLRHDQEAAIYLHEYTIGGVTVRGLVGALDISRVAQDRVDAAVIPHEGIHPRQVEDLAARMSQMRVNPAPILLVHRGPETVRRLLDGLQALAPDREFTDRGGQHHRVWAIREPDSLALIERELAGRQALIADGHHRYAAYLQLRSSEPGPATEAGLAMLVDQDASPLHLGPIHRVLGHTTLDALAAAGALVGADLRDSAPNRALADLAADTLVATDGDRWATLRLDLPPDRLAVEVLHERVVPALRPHPTRLAYHHTVDDTLADIGRRPGTAVLMPAPAFSRVLATCAADRLLPEKATSFQPKPNVGVLIRSLRDG